MIKGIIIFLGVVIALIIIDFIMAGFRSGMQGIPFSVAWLLLAGQDKEFRKRVVKVDHDMTAEELLAFTSIERYILALSLLKHYDCGFSDGFKCRGGL